MIEFIFTNGSRSTKTARTGEAKLRADFVARHNSTGEAKLHAVGLPAILAPGLIDEHWLFGATMSSSYTEAKSRYNNNNKLLMPCV